jgi:hypothetical protein
VSKAARSPVAMGIVSVFAIVLSPCAGDIDAAGNTRQKQQRPVNARPPTLRLNRSLIPIMCLARVFRSWRGTNRTCSRNILSSSGKRPGQGCNISATIG